MSTTVVLELTGIERTDVGARIHRDGAIIGRSTAVDVPITDASASRQHARLNRKGDNFELENLSPNGTLVNGKRVERRVLKDGDVIQIGVATRLKVRYLTQTGAIVSHVDPSVEAGSAAAFSDVDYAADAPVKVAPPSRSLLLRPKVLIGLSLYFVCLLAVCMVLSTHEPQIAPPTGLSREEIAAMMENYFGSDSRAFNFEPDGKTPRRPDPKREQDALVRAREAYNTAPVSSRSLWTAAQRFRDAQAYNPEGGWRNPDDARRFRQVREQLSTRVADKYVEALAEQRKGRLKQAREAFQRLREMVPDRHHPLNQHVGKWIQAINRQL